MFLRRGESALWGAERFQARSAGPPAISRGEPLALKASDPAGETIRCLGQLRVSCAESPVTRNLDKTGR